MDIRVVDEAAEKQKITRLVLEALPDWFEVIESREGYIKDSAVLPVIAAFDGEKPVGFICLKETGKRHPGDPCDGRAYGLSKSRHRESYVMSLR